MVYRIAPPMAAVSSLRPSMRVELAGGVPVNDIQKVEPCDRRSAMMGGLWFVRPVVIGEP
jgi:hypothetical protein